MKEHELINEIIPMLPQTQNVVVGPGDDCAALDVGTDNLLLIATDQVVGDIHYLRSSTSPEQIALKLLNRNLSDIAAMGGAPSYAVVTIAARNHDQDWFIRFFQMLASAGSKRGIAICGGDISSLPETGEVLTLTINGWVAPEKLCCRNQAKSGQLIYATGQFGNSFATNHHLNFEPRLAEAEFLAGTYTSCMIDVSDGLLADLSHILKASAKAARLETGSIPCRGGCELQAALCDGEDHELLFTVEPNLTDSLHSSWPFEEIELTCIGEILDGPSGSIIDAEGHDLLQTNIRGFDHFDE